VLEVSVMGAFDLTEKEKWHIFRMNENEMKDFVS
jgi:hypothetical protein